MPLSRVPLENLVNVSSHLGTMGAPGDGTITLANQSVVGCPRYPKLHMRCPWILHPPQESWGGRKRDLRDHQHTDKHRVPEIFLNLTFNLLKGFLSISSVLAGLKIEA